MAQPESGDQGSPPGEAQPRNGDGNRCRVGPSELEARTLDEVLSATPAPIFLYDRECRFLYANQAGAAALGRPQDQVVGKTWCDLGVPAGIADPFQAALKEVFATGQPYTGETQFPADGGVRSFEYIVKPVRGPAGGTESVVATFSDITERKRAAATVGDALARAEEARRDAEAASSWFHALLENAPDGIVLVDAEGHIRMVNTQAERLSGYQREDLIGQPVEALVPDRYRERHVGHRADYMAEPRTRPMGIGLDLYLRRRDGGEVPVEISLSPMQTAEGTLVTAVIRDISGRKQTEREIRRLNEDLRRRASELEAINKEMEAFSYSVSHDLRAPLRLIDGFSRALTEDYADKLDDEGKEYLTWVRQSVQQMAALIDDLLRLSRTGRAEMRFEDVDLSALAGEIARELQQTDPARQVEWMIASGVHVEGDLPLLRVALENLLGNAWKFTSKRPTARIEFGTTTVEGEPAYFVRDNGAGFDMAYAEKLFTPFQRLHTVEEFAGSGIGLALVQRIIHRHGGRIWAEGAVDQGATFTFTLGRGKGEP